MPACVWTSGGGLALQRAHHVPFPGRKEKLGWAPSPGSQQGCTSQKAGLALWFPAFPGRSPKYPLPRPWAHVVSVRTPGNQLETACIAPKDAWRTRPSLGGGKSDSAPERLDVVLPWQMSLSHCSFELSLGIAFYICTNPPNSRLCLSLS